jgi:serine/threonine-protein kinase
VNIAESFVLRRDVVLVPVTELSAEVRAKIEYDDGDYALSRLHGRMTSQIIDGETASLLELFREPTTIVDAVIRNGRVLSKDPQLWLEELLPHIGMFIQNKVLVAAGEEEQQEARQPCERCAYWRWDAPHRERDGGQRDPPRAP